jgi:hypothetical protein
MKACGVCGTELSDSALFCTECGQSVAGPPKGDSDVSSPPPPPSMLTPPSDSTSGPKPSGGVLAAVGRHKVITAVVVGVVALGILGVLGVVALGVGRTAKTPSEPDLTIPTMTDAEKNQQTLDALLAATLKDFNTRVTNKGYTALASRGKTYVSVGLSADYPDQILITLAFPAFSGNNAWQYTFPTDPGAVTNLNSVPQMGSASYLPDSVKDWNAHLDADGNVLLNGWETQSTP